MPSMAQSTTAVACRVDAHGRVPDDHSEFLAQVAQRESRGRVAKRPFVLSAEEHAANRKRLKRTFVKPSHAIETQINVAGIFRKWQRYCEEMNVGEWEGTLKELQRETTMDFFLFVCGNYSVTSWGTTHVYIRHFQQLYTTVTGRFMDRNDAREVNKVGPFDWKQTPSILLHKQDVLTEAVAQYHRQVLIPNFGLRAPNIDLKPVVDAAGLEVLLLFNIAYDTTVFASELVRINNSACYKIMCYTGARPAELVHNERRKPKDGSVQKLYGSKIVRLPNDERGTEKDNEDDDGDDEAAPDEASRRVEELLSEVSKSRGRPKALCYEDISLVVARHPTTGLATLAMAIKFTHHKGADNKPKPTVFFFTPARKLVFCVISDIVALALHDDAFDAPSLKNATSVLGTRIPAGSQSIPLRWKTSKLKVPVFRRVDRNGVMSKDEPMAYHTLRDNLGNQSEDAGFETRATPRGCRRGCSNAANGNAPDAIRDQAMRHDPRFFTFHNAYLNQIVEWDFQNEYLQEKAESAIYQLFAHISLTRDPRAKRDMVPDVVWANLPPDPEIVELEQQRALLKQGQYRIAGLEDEEKIRNLTEQIRVKKSRREYLIVKEYRQYYFYTQPTRDIERQARGEVDEEYEVPKVELNIPERARLAELSMSQPDNWSDAEVARRRIEYIDLKVSLCRKRETRRRTCPRTRRLPEPPMKRESPGGEPAPVPDPFPLLMDPTQCPVCIGDERLSREERIFRFCRTTVRNDHFDDQHLESHELAQHRGDPIRCEHPKCVGLELKTVDHFRNHVLAVHKVALRAEERAGVRLTKKRKASRMARRRK